MNAPSLWSKKVRTKTKLWICTAACEAITIASCYFFTYSVEIAVAGNTGRDWFWDANAFVSFFVGLAAALAGIACVIGIYEK